MTASTADYAILGLTSDATLADVKKGPCGIYAG